MKQADIIAKVPTEIWVEVFQYAQKKRTIEATHTETKFTRCDIPISVSQVCDRFRQIALNAPGLWTSVVVNFSSPSCLSVAKLWIERSKNFPLSIFIYNMKGSELEEIPDRRECLLLLLSQIGRWREAAIEWSKTDTNFWESMGIINPAPVLESLILRPSVDEDKIREGLLPSMLWTGSPHFRKLVALLWVVVEDDDDFYPPEDEYSSWTISNNIPYEQLTHLRLDATAHEIVSCDEITTIFEGASNLICCFLSGISGPEWSIELRPTPILLGSLRHLYLEASEDGVTHNDLSVSQLLNLITAPSLSSLTLVDEDQFDSEAYEGFMLRSSCPLEELNLINTNVSNNQIHHCMKLSTSSLRKLHVNNLKKSDRSLNVLGTSLTTWNSATGMFLLCPRLEQVSLSPLLTDLMGKEMYNGKIGPLAFSLITQILEARLQHPEGGRKTFKRLVLPSRSTSYVANSWLGVLCEEPFSLKVEYSDNMVDEDHRRISLWKRLAYQ